MDKYLNIGKNLQSVHVWEDGLEIIVTFERAK